MFAADQEQVDRSSPAREWSKTPKRERELNLATNAESNAPSLKYETVHQAEVPKGREGKHKRIVTELMSDLQQLKSGRALKVPLATLPDTKENIRAALNRATRQKGIDVATSSDAEFLYIWRVEGRS